MAQVGFCALLMFHSLFSGLIHLITCHICKEGKMYKKDRPNFIIILADDIGWGDLWVKRPDNSTPTPWLDSLMLKGKRFTDFHSPASTCSPSRAALLTGRHGLRNGVTHNFAEGSVGGLPLNETTFAQLLHDAGYYTAMIGKWHLGHNSSYNPVHRVMTWAALTNQALTFPAALPASKHEGCYTKVALPLFENETIVEQPLDTWSLKERYATAAVTQILTASVSRKQPFLLYVSLAHMHVPLFHNTFLNVTTQDPYTASLSDMDSLVGTIMQAVSNEQLENTLIWFTGDNGPWEQKCQFSGNVGPFVGKWQTSRGGGSAKRTTWEGGHRVPTVVAWPKKIKPNSTSSALLSGLDIFPTILSLAGVKPPSGRRYDGIDITDILLNNSDTGHKSLMHPNSGAAGQFGDFQTIRLRNHKAFYITGGSVACGGGRGKQQYHDPPLIFDLSRDEAEETPLNPESEEYRSVLKEVEREREALLWDIATDKVSTADYTVIPAAIPCCRPHNPACRCHSLK
ncbi:arylsulfatase G isoform X2 [Myxocyprinus asiaticus]|uniref:arylsulfatase G isoform X2 n=1 Tax=Myxocyprinus asiaticus TaxID=70543 RepID=UPI002221B7D5|nr:arylsulfatase G isoform X2 [Myxocyprinus asiaticus]